MTHYLLFCCNGIGDKLLDIIGANVYSYLSNKDIKIILNNNIQQWSHGDAKYHIDLFNFEDLNIVNTIQHYDSDKLIRHLHPSISFSPYKVYKQISKIKEISFEEILNEYNRISNKIKPSHLIEKYIPENIENAYGIHLRKSDKISDIENIDIRHENTFEEYQIILEKLLLDIEGIIITDEDPSFFLASEDNEWKHNFEYILNNLSKKYNKKITIINYNINETNNLYGFNAILDLFCLSRCKKIYQSVKYSSFSISAALIGNKSLVNYSSYLESNNTCIIHAWNKYENINSHKEITEYYPDFIIIE
jgi:hypothetical protein